MTVRLLAFALAGSLLVPATSAQPDDPSASSAEQAVRATLNALFDGMRAGESAAVRGVFADGAQVRAVEQTGDTTKVQGQSADAFARAVGQPHDAIWDERVWDVKIRVDGPMATAWMSYAFYLGEEFSHCGVNSMQLVHREGGWKIVHIIYTRRQDCDVPAEVRK